MTKLRVKKRNAVARDLLSPKYRQRVERPKKGRKSFKREKRVKDEE